MHFKKFLRFENLTAKKVLAIRDSYHKEVLALLTSNRKEVLASCRIQPQEGARRRKKLPACGRKKKFLRVHYFWAVL